MSIIHVDMDAFYASVEQRDNPNLRGQPVIVGGHPKRGVVLAASYEVRPFGVRSAMPMVQALRLAPKAMVVPPRFAAYVAASEAIFAIFAAFTPLIESLSLDEAFLDVSGSQRLFGSGTAIAMRIRQKIAHEQGLNASAGIANVKFIAKIASDLAKPNGQREVREEEGQAFLAPLPIARLWGVGPKTEARLHELGLRTIGDVAARGEAWMSEHAGSQGAHFWRLSQGIDPRAVESDRQAKSIGAEDTFVEDVALGEMVHAQLHSQALRVAARLRQAQFVTRVVQLKLKLSDFTLLTRQVTLPAPTDDGQRLYQEVRRLLARLPKQRQRIRLTGVSAEVMVKTEPDRFLSPDLFPSVEQMASERATRLNQTLDRIAGKFGQAALTTGDLLQEKPDDEARRLVGAARFDRS